MRDRGSRAAAEECGCPAREWLCAGWVQLEVSLSVCAAVLWLP